MDMRITFPGGARVDAAYKGFTIRTDQPEQVGGQNTAPSPFDLFLASLGTCAGYYVLSFCQQRGISANGIELVLRTTRNKETGLIGLVEIEIQVPVDFPDEYREAVVRAASHCAVKKHLANPPEFAIAVQKRS